MNRQDPINPRQLEEWLQSLEDGTISSEDRDLLDEKLRSCPNAREKYFEHMLFSSALLSESLGYQLMAENTDPNYQKIDNRRQFRVALLSAAAAVAIIGILLSFFAVKPLPPATVEGSSQSQWNFEEGGISKNRDFQPNSRINVTQGMVRIGFPSGTTVVMKAPAKLVIRNRMEVVVQSGRGWFEVDDADKGFTVKTKTLKATDLGTVFGVAVTKTGDSVHVESGLVKVESVLPSVKAVLLESAQAIASNTVGHFYPTNYDSRSFSKSLNEPYEVIRMDFD